MWTPGSRQAGSNKDTCETCGNEVEPEQPALECGVCEKWEHVGCLRRPDRIETKLYEALIKNQSKALLYCCTTCRRKGCIVKQLYKLQADLAVANEQRLASARAEDEARDLIEVLKADKVRLLAEVDELRSLGTIHHTSPEPSLTLRILIAADYHKLRNFSDVLAQQIGIIYR